MEKIKERFAFLFFRCNIYFGIAKPHQGERNFGITSSNANAAAKSAEFGS
jgi:hypothetical protein